MSPFFYSFINYLMKDIFNHNNKGKLHGYILKNYRGNKLSYRGIWKKREPFGYVEMGINKTTNFYIK